MKLRKLVGGCLSRVYKSPPLTPDPCRAVEE